MAGTAHAVVLIPHISAGVVALGAGPLVVLLRGRPQRALTVAYQVAVAVLAVTAVALVVFKPFLWGLVPIAFVTEAAALSGWRLRRRQGDAAWTPWQVRLLGFSYVSLVVALLVISVGGLASWIVPSVIGFVITETLAARVGRRPAASTTPLRAAS